MNRDIMVSGILIGATGAIVILIFLMIVIDEFVQYMKRKRQRRVERSG